MRAKIAAHAPTRYREVVPTVSNSGSDFKAKPE